MSHLTRTDRGSQNARSDRIEYIAINTVAFNKISGGTEGRPDVEYIFSNEPSSSASTESTTTLIRRIGCSNGIRSSVLNDDNIDN